MPVAIGIAILKRHLYEIDRLISRTLSWAIITAVLVSVFVAGVFGLQAALAGFTQYATLAVAGSTLATFALFQPLRKRVQRLVDRRFDRARFDASSPRPRSPSGCGARWRSRPSRWTCWTPSTGR